MCSGENDKEKGSDGDPLGWSTATGEEKTNIIMNFFAAEERKRQQEIKIYDQINKELKLKEKARIEEAAKNREEWQQWREKLNRSEEGEELEGEEPVDRT